MVIDEKTTILAHDPVGPGYRLLVLGAPRLAAGLRPGQFVHVRIPALEPSALRRPFSVFDADGGRVSILYKEVGRGTAALAAAGVGDALNVLGPLGHGFPETCGGTPLLVGGGFGVAPLHFLARRLLRVPGGTPPVLFVGGRTASDLLALDRFAALGVETHVATDDGSAGVRGFAVDPLDDALAGLRERNRRFELFACGPDGLLRAVAERAVGTGSKGWISMDRHMVCGVGACFACIQPIRLPDGSVFNARCCVNGPVFEAADIVW